jgi:hypothetical protein
MKPNEYLGLGFCLGVILAAIFSLTSVDVAVRHTDMCDEHSNKEWCRK